MAETGYHRRQLLLAGALGGVGLFGMALQPKARAEDRLDVPALDGILPERVGEYRVAGREGLVLPADTPESQRTNTDVAMRLYRAPNMPIVMLLIARGAASAPGLGVHRPERCYPSAGFEVDTPRAVPLSGPVPMGAGANFLVARRAERREQIYFWIRVGNQFPTSGWDQRMATINANLRGWMPPTVLFRLSVVGEGDARSLSQLQAFNGQFLDRLSLDARQILLGA